MRDVVLVLMLAGLAWFVWSMLFPPLAATLRRQDKPATRDEIREAREEGFWRGVDAARRGSAYADESRRPERFKQPWHK